MYLKNRNNYFKTKLETNKKVLKTKKTFVNESLFKKNAIISLNRLQLNALFRVFAV